MLEFGAVRLMGWMTYEPIIGLMMVVGAVVLFLGAYRRGSPPSTFGSWTRRIIESSAYALLFLGLLWAFRAVLNDNNSTFSQNHGRVSEANYQSLQTIWGAPHVQRELEVHHYRTIVEQEETWREDPTLPPLYRNVEREISVEQNTILSSQGHIELTTNERQKGSALYNGFNASFSMTYVISNDSPHLTRVSFYFPLSGQVLYEDLKVLEDGIDISRNLRFSGSAVSWTREMSPSETHEIAIEYQTRGVEYFYYQVPNPRELRDFALTMDVNGIGLIDGTRPGDVLRRAGSNQKCPGHHDALLCRHGHHDGTMDYLWLLHVFWQQRAGRMVRLEYRLLFITRHRHFGHRRCPGICLCHVPGKICHHYSCFDCRRFRGTNFV